MASIFSATAKSRIGTLWMGVLSWRMTICRKTIRPETMDVSPPSSRPTDAELDQLIDEALTDAYDESEQVCGFGCTVENNVAFPFATTLLGVSVKVIGVDITHNAVYAKVRRGSYEQKIPLEELPLPSPLPAGGNYLLAYRCWRGV